MFICETKKKKSFVSTICKKIGWGERQYAVDPIGQNGLLILGWGRDVTIYQIKNTTFSVEVEFETLKTKGRMWTIFVYANNKESVRVEQ